MKKGDIKRARIIDTAEQLFFERGYDRTSIQDILDALGMSKGGFYHYFDAKDTVLKEIMARRNADRFDRLSAELQAGRRTPVEKLNLLLSLVNLFQTEDARFSALMVKLCYIDREASIREHCRRILLERLTPLVDEVFDEGLADGSFHSRYPAQTGSLLLMLACDVDEDACEELTAGLDNPDVMIGMIERLGAYREAVEQISGAPYGSINLYDPGHMIAAWQAALSEIKRLEEKPL